MLRYDLKESGNRLKELRKEKKVTQAVASEAIGISVDGYRQIENAINGASIDTLILMALYYDTTVDYIVTGRKCIVEPEDTAENEEVADNKGTAVSGENENRKEVAGVEENNEESESTEENINK